jgi:hypothetical protein
MKYKLDILNPKYAAQIANMLARGEISKQVANHLVDVFIIKTQYEKYLAAVAQR